MGWKVQREKGALALAHWKHRDSSAAFRGWVAAVQANRRKADLSERAVQHWVHGKSGRAVRQWTAYARRRISNRRKLKRALEFADVHRLQRGFKMFRKRHDKAQRVRVLQGVRVRLRVRVRVRG